MELVAQRKYLLVVALLTLTFLYVILHYTGTQNLKVVYETDALYSRILVHELDYNGDTLRMLKNDANQSSATLMHSYDLVFGYSQFSEFYTQLKPDASRYLLIGGGAYTIPRTLVARHPQLHVDVVEIEPVLFDIAQEYFDLTDLSRITNYPMDGRVFFREHDTKYDVIFGDAFNTDYNIPTHLASHEFFEEVDAHLADDGVFILNYAGSLQNEAPSLTGSFLKTVQATFPNVQMYAFDPKRKDQLQNILFVAQKGVQKPNLDQETVIQNAMKKWVLKDMRLEPEYFDLKNELVFTDDKAPIEYLMFKQS
jgi:spermidine synthase